MKRHPRLRTSCALLTLAVAASGCQSVRDRFTKDTCVACPSAVGTVVAEPYVAQPFIAAPSTTPTLKPFVVPPEVKPVVKPAVTAWPGSTKGLVFTWTDGTPANLKRWGKAHITEAGALDVSDGAYLVEGYDAKLLEACRRSNELTIETVLQSKAKKQVGPARIISFSTDSNSRNFTLGQEGENLILRLRTSKTGPNGSPPETTLCPINPDQPFHLLVTYRAGSLICYVNGKEVHRTDKVQGDFSNWSEQHLILGDEYSRERDWDGRLTRIAIFSRAFNAKDVKDQYERVLRSARK